MSGQTPNDNLWWDSPAAEEAVREIVAVSFDKIPVERLNWLWPDVVPFGMLTLIVGDPGHGKSLLTLELAARLSSGTCLPDNTRPTAADALLVFCEDGAGSTVRPRLDAAGADLRRVHHLTLEAEDGGLLVLPRDMGQVERHVQETGARLIVFDPVNAFLDPRANSWKDNEVRRALAPLTVLGARTGCAVVGIMHLNKAPSAHALQRVTGSIAFVGVARSVFLVGPHPEDRGAEPHQQRKLLASVKTNLSAAPNARSFRIVSAGATPRIVWGDVAHITSDSILASEMGATGWEENVKQAEDFLKEFLGDGPRKGRDVYEAAKTQGIPWNTVKRAARVLHVGKTPLDKGGAWYWRLPDNQRRLELTPAEGQMVTEEADDHLPSSL